MTTIDASPQPGLLPTQEHALSTLRGDGSREWIDPTPSYGRWRWRRQVVGVALLTAFVLTPHLTIGGKPVLLLDVAARRFTILGKTFLPTDTLLLALFMVSVGLGVALVTALFGRAFCGWGCPHTLFMEFVIRPIERLTKARPNAKSTTAGMAAKYLLFLISAWVLGNTILAYFIGGSTIRTWMTQSPLQHPWPFVATAAMTAAFFFHVAYFREQLCLLACPYGRLQSALLDKQSLIVAYDVNRGEPRGKRRPGVYSLEVLGDCIDCGACTRTCPTGIDIRNGLQMECVNCTQCIDACDAMMTKVGRPMGLVRYASAAGMEGQPNRLLRPRTLLYPAALAVSLSLFFCVLFTRTSFDAVVFRAAGAPFVMAGDGRVHNTLRIKLVNRHDEPTEFRLESTTPGTTLSSATMPHRVDPGVTFEAAVEVSADKDGFQNGGRDLGIAVTNSRNERRTLTWRMIGPR